MATLGLISDTHGYVEARLPALFAGVERIVHAGDVGSNAVLEALEQIAPVTAVLGNTDVALPLREVEVFEFGGRRWCVRHELDRGQPGAEAEHWLVRVRAEVVVYGHTHRACQEWREGRLFVNPGYAGRPKSGLARTVALAHLAAGGLRIDHVRLDD